MGSEAAAIGSTTAPATVESLAVELRQLGLADGAVVIVHSSLSRLGYVAGGAHAVVLALVRAVGPTGTVVMPTHSSDLSDPAHWQHPPAPPEWHDTIRHHMPAFDPRMTPTRGMGAIVECFRHHPNTIRSNHPKDSFAAHGALAATITADHALDSGLGEQSPLARLYEHDAWVLLLGVGHGNNTSLHLAEHRAQWPSKTTSIEGSPIVVDGQRQWVSYADLDVDEGDFDLIGEAFAATGAERSGSVGAGTGRLCRQRELVDFAVAWIEANRLGG